jgi:hypothetical protein
MHAFSQFVMGSSQEVRASGEISESLVLPHGQCVTTSGERGQWPGSVS